MSIIIDKDLYEKVVGWRREIHQNAELSFNEHKTQSLIERVLDIYGIVHERVAFTGVLAKLNPDSGQGVGVLRADMDALEICEKTGLSYSSKSGVMHACGHDMHTAALLGAIVSLKLSGCKREVWALFQPGEEMHPGGASIVISEGVFEGVDVKWFLAQHCSPEIECGSVGIRAGQFMASTDEIHITVKGKGGHGAMPHLAKDAVLASCAVVMAIQSINSRENNAFVPSVISFGKFIANGATNVLPDDVLIEGTFRTMDENWRAYAKGRIIEVAQNSAKAYRCDAIVDIKDGYPSVFNSLDVVEKFKPVASKFSKVIEIDRRMTAEDFGFFSQRYPSFMYRLGVGGVSGSGALHTSTFNPNEESLRVGVEVMANFANSY